MQSQVIDLKLKDLNNEKIQEFRQNLDRTDQMLQFKDIVMYIEKFHNITDSNQSNEGQTDHYMKFEYSEKVNFEGGLWEF